jgi:PAS domain S-box-containing protein/putative nucleotidyltransferase with HDIG domain
MATAAPERGFISVNETFCHMLGYSREELTHLTWDLLTHPDDLALDAAQLEGGLSGESDGYTMDKRFVRKDGDVVHTTMAVRAVRGSGASLDYFATVLVDITDRVRATDALKASEQRFTAFADHLPGELWIRDAESRCLYANQQIAANLGMDVDEVVGSLPHDLWEGEALDQALAEHGRALAGEVVDVVREWPLPDGRERFFHMLAFPFGGDGGVTMVGTVEIDVTEQHEAEEQVRRQADQLRRTVEGAVLAMSHVVETRDPYTAGHEQRVSELCAAIGRELQLEDEVTEGLRLAGLIHDIGKIAVPAEILAKPGRLSEVEFNLIKQHAQSGYDILAAIDFERPVAAMVLQHHERLDGSGYPQGLQSDDILPEAKILAVADVVEAMSSHRPYRPALGTEAALEEIREYAGVKYDADAVAACSRLILEKGFVFSD